MSENTSLEKMSNNTELNDLIDAHLESIQSTEGFKDENQHILDELKARRAQEKEAREAVMECMMSIGTKEHTYRGKEYTTQVKEKVKYSKSLVESEFDEDAVQSYKRKYGEQMASMKVKRVKEE